MNSLLIVLGTFFSIHLTHSYVVQVRKSEKESVDASNIPLEKSLDQLNNVNQERKSLNNIKRFEVKKRVEDNDRIDDIEINRYFKKHSKGKTIDNDKLIDNDKTIDNDKMSDNDKMIDNDKQYDKTESVIVKIDTGAKLDQSNVKTFDFIDKIEKVIRDLGKNMKDGPLMRARAEYNIKPEVIHFRSGKPSLKFELNADSIIKAVQSLLSSKVVRRYADDVAQKAAVVLTVINEELKKPSNDFGA